MPTADRKREREILGAPLLPPPWLTSALNGVRRRLRGAHRRTAPPSLQVLEAVFGLFDNRVLGLLVEFVTSARPDAGRAFNDAMRAGALVQAVALAHGLDWHGVGTVCDVGGGTGAALRHLLDAHQHLHGVLLDLPEVVAHADPALVDG